VESAEAIGLSALGTARDVQRTTSRGVGELILAAVEAGARQVLVALGGSATNDGGAGALQALGARLEGAPADVRAGDVARIAGVERADLLARLDGVELRLLCDVNGPLTGPAGASLLYGPQKGASEHDARELDGARLESGADFVLDAVRFDERARAAELILTAEGSLDEQTLAGKVVVKVGARARALGIPAIALAGRVRADAVDLAARGIAAAFPLADGAISERESISRADELLALVAERVVRTALAARRAAQALRPPA
jgi:glycerate kinase